MLALRLIVEWDGVVVEDRLFRHRPRVLVGAGPAATTVSAVALRWLIQRPAVTSVILGVRTLAQLDDNLKAADIELPPEAMQRLDEASAFELGYPYEFMRHISGRW